MGSRRANTDAETAAHDIDFAWRATLAVFQQSWMLGDAQPARFPLTHDQLVHRLTQHFLAAVDHRRP